MRLAWATDLHLDHVLGKVPVSRFYETVKATGADALVVAGDVAQAASVVQRVRDLELGVGRSVYFVAGNHDYYGASVEELRHEFRLQTEKGAARWLPALGVVKLTDKTALIGHDGWNDGQCGSWWKSDVVLNDYRYIKELLEAACISPGALLRAVQHLAVDAATYFETTLLEAFKTFAKVVCVTHVPPFWEASTYQGKRSDSNYAPHFVSKIAGEKMLDVMRSVPEKELLVLCGHTHGSSEYQALPNLRVVTGGAVYGAPELQGVIEVV